MKFTLLTAATLAVASVSGPALAQAAPETAPPAAPAAPAATASAVVAGATVYGPDGNPVGTIEKVENGTALIDSGTAKAALPLDKFGTSDKGPTIGFTKAQFEAAVSSATPKAAQ